MQKNTKKWRTLKKRCFWRSGKRLKIDFLPTFIKIFKTFREVYKNFKKICEKVVKTYKK
jgi:hypothetical protein